MKDVLSAAMPWRTTSSIDCRSWGLADPVTGVALHPAASKTAAMITLARSITNVNACTDS